MKFEKNTICYTSDINGIDKIKIIKDYYKDSSEVSDHESILVYHYGYKHNVYVNVHTIFYDKKRALYNKKLLKTIKTNKIRDIATKLV